MFAHWLTPNRSTLAILFSSVLLATVACSTEDDVDPNDTTEDVGVTDDANGDDPSPEDTGTDDVGDTGQQDADVSDDPPPADPEKLDMLWMIDNSGSMCRSQAVLREGIDDFVSSLQESDVDFHIAVTTSHMLESCEYYQEQYDGDHPNTFWACDIEPVAVAGRLQATPQPIPGFNERCYHPIDPATDEPDFEKLDPLLESMEAAFGCLEDPEQWEYLWEFGPDMEWESEEQWETELRCTLAGAPGVNSGECDDVDRDIEDFFPDPEADPYRDIPLVLRSEDYRDEEGDLDVDALQDDFGCMSLVGNRGHGFKRGLDAVNLAISPEMTGGPEATAEERDQYPNAGFLRSDASTGVIFVSDENDCSHDGDLDETTACGAHQCTIEENRLEQGMESHLTSVEDLYSEFMLNLAQSRADIDIGEAEHLDELDASIRDEIDAVANTVYPSSIHGQIQHLDELVDQIPDDEIPTQCPEESREWTESFFWEVPPSCTTEMGRAWSGHRYSQFLGHFDQHFPAANADGDIPGEICNPFDHLLTEIVDFYGENLSDE